MSYLIGLCFVLILIIIFLIIKLRNINNSLKEISKELNKKMLGTNNLITISSNNKNIHNLAIKLNEDLKKMHEIELQYNNGNKELNKTITNISHDLRTPLTVIKGYIDLLKKEKDIKKIKKDINIIAWKAEELERLTDELFAYSKALDLKDALNFEKVCLNNLLEEIILSYYALFKEKNIKPIIHICKKKIYKNVDKELLMRIWENIISNAFKYAEKEIIINLLEKGEIIFVNKTNAFENNTLDKTSIDKIFDRYYTVENGKKSVGVGLNIAKELTSLLGGNIEAYYKNNYLIIKMKL